MHTEEIPLNLIIGAAWEQIFRFTIDYANDAPVNLTGYEVQSQIWDEAGGTLITTFTATIEDALDGQVKLALSSAATTALLPGDYVWSLLWKVTAGDPVVAMGGTVKVEQGVTQWT